MNLNYVGSVAERFMKFRSTLQSEEMNTSNIFNAVSIYVPKSLAADQFASGSYDPSAVTTDTYAVIAITVDNYNRVMKEGSALLSQWVDAFNDGTNVALTLYAIVFDDTSFAPTVSAGGISWEPLTKAFRELYFISFFKTMFSEHYDGSKDEDGDAPYDDSNYFDMALALSYLCEMESTLSFMLCEYKVNVFAAGEEDENLCKVMSLKRGDETTHCTTFVGSTPETRAQYFWGFLNLMGFKHTELHVHNGSFMIPIIIGKWFEEKNVTGEFVGNKLARIRLSGNKVKPTGLPSPLNSDVNLNLDPELYEILDSKHVAYFISISDGTDNNAELVRDRSGSNFPINAYMISKWIDYNASQDMANFVTARSTLTKPVLTNQQAYSDMQSILVGKIQLFAGLGRLSNVQLNFPPFAEAKKGNKFEGTAVWKAVYTDDLESVDVSGSITF